MGDGLFSGLMDQAQEIVASTQPKCEVCGGTLAGGSITCMTKVKPLIMCLKCNFTAVDYWMTEREKKLKLSK